MIIDISLALALSFCFNLFGVSIMRISRIRNMELAGKILIGFALCITLFAINIRVTVLQGFLFGTLIVAFLIPALLSLRDLKTKPIVLSVTPLFTNILLTIPALFISWLCNNSFAQAKSALRVGPDTLGWLLAGKYLCSSNNLSALAMNVGHEVSRIVTTDSRIGQWIYTDPSVGHQAMAEWLIGARRLGIPALGGFLCRQSGQNVLYHFYNSLMIIGYFLLTRFVYSFLSKLYKRESAIILSIIVSLGVNVLASTMQGGLGEIFTIVFCVAFFNAAYSKKYNLLVIFLVFCILYGITTYFDAVLVMSIIAVPVIWTYKSNLRMSLYSRYRSLLFIFLGIPFFLFVPIQLVSRINSSQGSNGWDQGRKPSLMAFSGLVNWLPSDGIHPLNSGLILKIIEITASIIITYLCFATKNIVIRRMSSSILIFYACLLIYTYLLNRKTPNSYILMKAAGFYSVLIVLTILLHFSKLFLKTDSQSNSYSGIGSNFINYLPFILVSLIGISSAGWCSDFIKTRTFTLSTHNIQTNEKSFDNFDIEVISSDSLMPYKLALLGDLHYGSLSRGFGLSVLRSQPQRSKAYIFQSEYCNRSSCNYQGFHVNFKNDPINLGNNLELVR